MKRWLICLLSLLPILNVAQSGKAYFQQEVNYTIHVRLNDKAHSLSADISIEYINNSPDTLRQLWFHLWPNAYRNRNTALCKQQLENGDASLYFAGEEERGYIDSLDFTSNGKKIEWTYDTQHPDICVLQLQRALLPGEKIIIQTPFYVKIPNARFSRLGHRRQSYAITQWYPKPAVYDREGWHAMPYLDQGEFYSEYGSYHVRITLPENYIVGSTGDLLTKSEIIWMEQQSKLPFGFYKDKNFNPSSNNFKTLEFTQKDVHDFAWFADKNYYISKGEITLPISRRKVTTFTMYTEEESEYWKNSIQYLNQAVLFYSEKVGDYPYNHCTALAGPLSAGGGMEYPMVTVIGGLSSAFQVEMVIAHEVGHNWFYGILGSNERRYPWMDEGMNSSVEAQYGLYHHPSDTSGEKNELRDVVPGAHLFGLNKLDYHETTLFEYQLSASAQKDQPISLAAPDFTPFNYGTIVYKKSALAMNYLRSYLGDDIYNRCMWTYFDEWKFKHPQPSDVQEVFERVSGQSLNWFFNQLLHTDEEQDYKVKHFKREQDKITFTAHQKSGIAAPFMVAGMKDGFILTEKWLDTTSIGQAVTIPCQECDEVRIDPKKSMMEINYRNNSSRRSLPKIRLLPTVSTLDRNYIYLLPVAGWNDYNKFMAGISICNKSVPVRNFEYAITPVYAFGNERLSGTAHLSYSIYPVSRGIREIRIANQLRSFTYGRDSYRGSDNILKPTDLSYLRYSPSVMIQFRQRDARSSEKQTLVASSVHLWEDNIVYDFSTNLIYGNKEMLYKDFYRLRYTYQNSRRIDPYSFSIGAEANKDLLKGDLIGRYNISYKKFNKRASFRLYLGYTFEDETNGLYGFFLSDRNAARGSTDYAYDDYYFGRTATEGILYQQMALRQGAFKAYSPLGSYRNYIAALNINIDLPVPLPIRLYADIGTAEDFKKDVKAVYDISQTFSYNAGVCFSLIREAVEVYFPLVKSAEIRRYNETNDIRFSEEIRFVFDLHALNPVNLRSSVRD